jgi:hypothetical protein
VTPERRASETQVLYMNMIDYWYEVDLKGGAGVSEMYVEDGIFTAAPASPWSAVLPSSSSTRGARIAALARHATSSPTSAPSSLTTRMRPRIA